MEDIEEDTFKRLKLRAEERTNAAKKRRTAKTKPEAGEEAPQGAQIVLKIGEAPPGAKNLLKKPAAADCVGKQQQIVAENPAPVDEPVPQPEVMKRPAAAADEDHPLLWSFKFEVKWIPGLASKRSWQCSQYKRALKAAQAHKLPDGIARKCAQKAYVDAAPMWDEHEGLDVD